ncbi:WhiB family transcriptional regulator [Iamia sp.]|uniref:WhiB family transcriptional regulator n=1 Tax=Iamia sp. TaxID=2722710 RepID=UPI002CC70CB2|nr:WhiB family transcriptional regulator [Iamia sp.]HXH58445.1 WhiB family transcriptional regulator [Iamia sp.]
MSAAELDMSWQEAGACQNTPIHWWFPEAFEGVPPEARALCRACPVFAQCHAHALRHEQHGVWAATSPRQRRRLRKAAGLRSFVERDPDVVADVAQMFERGFTPPQIGEALGMNRRTVYRTLAAAGHDLTPVDNWRRQARTGSNAT